MDLSSFNSTIPSTISEFGTLPVAINVLPSNSPFDVTTEFSLISSTSVSSKNSISPRNFSSRYPLNSSSISFNTLDLAMTFTSLPKLEKILDNSAAIIPPPMMFSFSGTSSN